MAFTFEKLIVYQKSIDFADSVCGQTEGFARSYGFLFDKLALKGLNSKAQGNALGTRRHPVS